ncbi:MAG: DUF3874 domain-containing protein [Bacteroidaceae bacterium]|nr:DUF3874 domain-containing protein [Bacteroidaceae bacterium]
METQTSFSPGEDTNVSGVLLTEQFLNENYAFQKNVISNKLEVLERGKEDASFQPLTAEAENSIIVRARKELGEVKGLKTLLTEQIHSNDVVTFDPVEQWLHNLPAWDGCDRVAELFSRLPGISAEQVYWLSLWFRSAVAHWLKLDDIHGNESVPTLIGDQGCGKTVFCRRLLPKHLREYFLDHLNLSNRFDRDMAFSNNLLVVLDELDQIKANQQAALKQSLSKNTVNGRPIFGRAQMDRHRYASFMATTNNPRPLNDPTGSRRFICVRIPNGALIDNEKPIDYEQLYAQLVDEVEQRRLRWWFTASETEAIQKANLPYQHVYSITEMVSVCFRLPRFGEKVVPMTIAQIMETMQEQFPELDMAPRMKAQVGATMKRLGFEQRRRSDGNCYLAVAREVA